MSGLTATVSNWMLSSQANCKPVENGYIESFNCRLRVELLSTKIFCTLAGAEQNLEI